METRSRTHSLGAPFLHPFETGVIAFILTGLSHLVLPGSGGVWIDDRGWPWLDAYRIGHPAEIGWLSYLGAGFVVSLALGFAVGGVHLVIMHLIGRGWVAWPIGWLIVAAALGFAFWLPTFLHRFQRIRLRPPKELNSGWGRSAGCAWGNRLLGCVFSARCAEFDGAAAMEWGARRALLTGPADGVDAGSVKQHARCSATGSVAAVPWP